MNFKKSKDVKRSSYYVWFLGSKESKGLRGDEYVTPVLNYLLDCGDCDGGAPVEPSKVTLQVSSKGLKIIQILTVPRKSSQKLSADQQSQLFANSGLLKQSASSSSSAVAVSSSSSSSSMLKSEQVKHHIPHNSITWVYQEEDVICAILLLYNPLTRCPVHVHAYRCDSVETADSLRAQLQALVSRPENQKKFRDIESRLRAKGLLLSRFPSSAEHDHDHDRCNADAYNYAEEEELPPLPPVPIGPNHVSSHCPSKTLKSDGRSTRTEGSDELNSEESNSSDLGYAIRSKNVHSSSQPHHHQQLEQHHQKSGHSMMMMMPPQPLMSMHHQREHPNGGIRDKLPSASKKKHSTQQHLLPPSAAHFKQQQQQQQSGKESKGSKQSKSKPFYEEAELPAGATAALYDSLAAELRAKLGNPKMGPLLLPPRDYDGTNNNKKNKENISKQTMFPLTRSESSGKSSSGIGSEEALSNENQTKKSNFYGQNHYNDIDCHHEQPQSFIDFDHDYRHRQHKRTSNSYLFGGKPEKSQLYSLQMQNAYSSEEEDDEDDEEEFHHRSCDHLEVDVEDIEEDVLFTANCNRKSKSTFDLFPQYKSFQPIAKNAVTNNNNNNNNNNSSVGNNFAGGFEVAEEASKYRRREQHQQQPSYPSPLEMSHLQPFAGERKSRSRNQPQHQHQQQQLAKMYASNPNLSRNPLKEVKQTSDKSAAFVMGRREQRTLHQQQQLISDSSPPVGKFSFGAMPPPPSSSTSTGISGSSHRQAVQQQQKKSSKQPPKFYFADAEFGDSKMPFFPSPLDDNFAVASGGDKSNKANRGSGRNSRHHLGRSSGNLACLDYTVGPDCGPTSLASYNYSQQQQRHYRSAEGRCSPEHFRSPRQETRYEMPPPPQPPMAPTTPASSSSAGKFRSSGGGHLSSSSSAYLKNGRGNSIQQQQQYGDQPSRGGYDHELAMRKKLEQPYSRYSYIDVEHHRAERFHYVPPAAMRR